MLKVKGWPICPYLDIYSTVYVMYIMNSHVTHRFMTSKEAYNNLASAETIIHHVLQPSIPKGTYTLSLDIFSCVREVADLCMILCF